MSEDTLLNIALTLSGLNIVLFVIWITLKTRNNRLAHGKNKDHSN